MYYPDVESAVQAVEDGDAWGVVSMEANFTQDLYQRIFESLVNDDLTTVDTELLERSSIKIRMDITNQHIAFTLQMKFVEAFQNFIEQLVSSCGIPKEIASIPLVFEVSGLEMNKIPRPKRETYLMSRIQSTERAS